eukprot:COSAG02_NODE_392_length_23227_cov_30.763620_19_plen_76_part_00
MLGRSTTFSKQIEEVGASLLGAAWGGVHASNKTYATRQSHQGTQATAAGGCASTSRGCSGESMHLMRTCKSSCVN